MATLAEVRTRVRTWLEDSGASPLWSNDQIDEGLRVALDGYSQIAPDQKTATITAAAGDTTLPLPGPAMIVVRLRDPNGYILPARAASPLRYDADEEQSWEGWDDELTLTRPATAGDYTVWYLATRTFPAADADAFPVPDVDLSLVLAGATYWAMQQRAGAEWKRGQIPARYQERLDAAKQDYNDLLAARRRRVRTTTVEVSG